MRWWRVTYFKKNLANIHEEIIDGHILALDRYRELLDDKSVREVTLWSSRWDQVLPVV